MPFRIQLAIIKSFESYFCAIHTEMCDIALFVTSKIGRNKADAVCAFGETASALY